nr:uncharacterized protein LOC106731856 [Pelodiscus sinensis]|eukprot:XP_014427923.1 uncharacterized protein LOC106731856 [Pelodiscus sinensis]
METSDRKYFVPSKDNDFLFTHPQPNSLVVDSAQQRAKLPQYKLGNADKDHKKLDSFGKKVYSSSTLQLRISNYSALLANHDFDNYSKLGELVPHLPESKRSILKTIVHEGHMIARTALQTAMDVADTATRITTTAVVIRRASWLQSSGVPRDRQPKVEDLPFDKQKLFAATTDEMLHNSKNSKSTLRTLGMYTPPYRRGRYTPYNSYNRYRYGQYNRPQRPYEDTRPRQQGPRRRHNQARPPTTQPSKQQI